MFIALITTYVIILQLLKIVYLLFKPKFLKAERFGPPSKLMLLAYYIVALFFLIEVTLEKLQIIKIEVTRANVSPVFEMPNNKGLIIIVAIASSIVLFQYLIEHYLKKRKKNSF